MKKLFLGLGAVAMVVTLCFGIFRRKSSKPGSLDGSEDHQKDSNDVLSERSNLQSSNTDDTPQIHRAPVTSSSGRLENRYMELGLDGLSFTDSSNSQSTVSPIGTFGQRIPGSSYSQIASNIQNSLAPSSVPTVSFQASNGLYQSEAQFYVRPRNHSGHSSPGDVAGVTSAALDRAGAPSTTIPAEDYVSPVTLNAQMPLRSPIDHPVSRYGVHSDDLELTVDEVEEIQLEVSRMLRGFAARRERRRPRSEYFYGDNFPDGPALEFQDLQFDEDQLDELREVLMKAPFMRNPFEGRVNAGELPDHFFSENPEPYYQAELENVRTWRVVESPTTEEEVEDDQEDDAGTQLLYQLALEMEEELANEEQEQQSRLVG